MLDHRNVYLKEQVTYRGKGRRIKIGIAKNMKSRHRQVNTGLPGDWLNLTSRLVFFAHSTEQHLHAKYHQFNTPLENIKPGSGGSEIFTISTHQLAILRLTLWGIKAADRFIAFTAMCFLCKIIFLLWYFLA